jgi:uncharacterized membrane protein YdfJ with MMPL/SSD domain
MDLPARVLIRTGLVAALLALLVGGFAILITFLLLRLLDQFTPISTQASSERSSSHP